MIIPDEVLIFGEVTLIIEIFIKSGLKETLFAISYGIISFTIMFLLKKLGDFLFKKESMGGGDIKLMFLFGLVLGPYRSVICIFLASFIGLPVSLIVLYKKKEHIIPFGPFLAISAIIITLTQININDIINFLTI